MKQANTNPYNRASHSALKHFERSPLHYKYYRDHPPTSTPALIFGNLFHCLVLEPKKALERYWTLDDSERPFPESTYAKKENKLWKEEQLIANEGKIIMSSEDMAKTKLMRDAVLNDPISGPLIKATGNEFEKKIKWKESGVPCSGILDIRNDLFLADLKTCQNADPDEFKRDIVKYKYFRQGAMYLAGEKFGRFDYEEKKPFFFIAVEKTEPFGVSVIKLSDEFISEGLINYRPLLKSLKVCIDKDDWPGYYFKSHFNEDGIFTATKPGWF